MRRVDHVRSVGKEKH